MAAHVGVVRVEGRRHRDQAQQVEPQQGLGGDPAGPHCPLPSVLEGKQRDTELLKGCSDVGMNHRYKDECYSEIITCSQRCVIHREESEENMHSELLQTISLQCTQPKSNNALWKMTVISDGL